MRRLLNLYYVVPKRTFRLTGPEYAESRCPPNGQRFHYCAGLCTTCRSLVFCMKTPLIYQNGTHDNKSARIREPRCRSANRPPALSARRLERAYPSFRIVQEKCSDAAGLSCKEASLQGCDAGRLMVGIGRTPLRCAFIRDT